MKTPWPSVVMLYTALLGSWNITVPSAQATETPTVAVLDFVAPGQPADSALLGLGDLLEAELSQYGLNVISRREVNLLLGERRLAREGFARIEDFQGGTLPWADFLLRCEFRTEGGGKAWASLRLVDARTAREVKAWNLAATQPMDALEEIPRHVPHIVAAVLKRPVDARPPQPTPGFTTIPEVARTFYRGLDHLVRGQPGYAAEYFRLAADADTNFTFAVLGQAKAYEYLGFPGVAEALRATLPKTETPEARHSTTGSVLTVRFVNRGGTFTPKSMARIRGTLQTTYGFSLFDPEWIPALSQEKDLKLTGEFPLLHGLDSRLWLRAEYMLVFSALEKELRVSAIDLARGQLLGTIADADNDLDDLCHRAISIVLQPAHAVETAVTRVQPSSTNVPTGKLNFTYSVDEVAFALEHLSAQPKDLARWVHLLCVMQPERLHPAVLRAFLDAHESAISAESPDAATWLASVLWARYYMAAMAAPDMPDIESHFAPLLAAYPDSLQSQVIRFHIARFLFANGERKRSRELAVQVAEQTAPRVLAMDSFVPLRGQYLDCIKQIDYSAFPNVIPPQGPRMKMLARDMFLLAASLCALDGDVSNTQKFLGQAAPLEILVFAGPPRSNHFGGPVNIYPVNIGVWQTGHIGYDWKPADPADEGRVQIGWTYLPLAMPDNKPTIARMQSTYALFGLSRKLLKDEDAEAVGVTRVASDDRSPEEIWHAWLNACTNGTEVYALETGLPRGPNAFVRACGRAQSEQGSRVVEFAGQAINEFMATAPFFAKEWGEIRTGKLALQLHWLAAHYCLDAGAPAEAWSLIQRALAWRGRDDLKFSLRYLAAMTAWRTGHDAESAEILRTLAEDPRSKDLHLVLPDKTRLPSVYQESVALLEKVRSGPAPDGVAVAIDLTAVKPYYMGGMRPGTDPPKKTGRRDDRTDKEKWAAIMSAWMEEQTNGGPPSFKVEDLQGENYEDWPDETAAPTVPSPPRFGKPYTHVLCDIDKVGIEFVWIEPMQIWAAKYELTEDALMYLMTSKETGTQRPFKRSYNQAKDVCAKMNERDEGRLPDGYCYRIPTVSEWEALARCGTDRIYPWGNELPPAFGNYAGADDQEASDAVSRRDPHRWLAPVGEVATNEWGLHGMGGNMQEWATSPEGKPVVKGASYLHTVGDWLKIDYGFEGVPPDAGFSATLRCVIAPRDAR